MLFKAWTHGLLSLTASDFSVYKQKFLKKSQYSSKCVSTKQKKHCEICKLKVAHY